ncbi:uncharacterized protein LOC131944098 [Physella acuta]|uniref:uncharacterized protein LOC131944098 n=1 Tax=Physella acuta TaxID=109671 RepID=UPI0027DC492A|nr:uncharacterized protein LOC131944098 [Physella acuta]
MKEVMSYFTLNNTFKAIKNMEIKCEDTLTVATVLLLDLAYDSTTYTDAISILNDYAKQMIGVNVKEINGTDFQRFKKSIRCYATITVLKQNKQTPSREELQDFVSDVMSEFSNMRIFDPVHFFMYQRCLKTISSAVNECDRLTFFSLLLKLNYTDYAIKSLEEKNLLNTTAPGFEMSLVSDVLILLCVGSGCSPDFALKLAELNIVKVFTDFLIESKNLQNTHSRFITKRVIDILLNIARRECVKKYFTSNNTAEAILNMKCMDDCTSFLSKLLVLLLEEDNILEKEEIRKVKRSVKEILIPAVRWKTRELSDVPLSVLLQGLSKFTEQDEYLNEILPLVPRLKEILSHEDIEEHIFTTKCIRELSRLPKASEKFIRDETLSDLLNKALSRGHKDISANVHSIRWRSGRATGMLPCKADFVVSEEFPKEFQIEPNPLAHGGFGSVHLVNDINGPKDVKFVTKKMFQKLNDSPRYMESFQKEASILIRLKHERIVQFHGFQKTENELLLFMEFVKMGTLSAFIKQHTKLNEDVTRKFTIQILEGVKYLHKNKVLHLDIKGNNILMADEANIKLTDFGLSTILNEEEGVEAETGTTRYMAPEMINCPDGRIFKHASSLDIWSVGCTVVEMITGSPPNATTTSVQVLFKMAMLQKPKYELPDTASEHLKEFLEKTFKVRAAKRPSADTLLREDPFVTIKRRRLH